MRRGIYVYCFIEGNADENIILPGMEKDTNVYFFTGNNITAVLSEARYTTYEPNKTNVLSHERVIQHLMNRYNLIPCSFGNVFRTKTDLCRFMEAAHSSIVDNLKRLKGKDELGLRLFWKKEAFSAEIETPDIIAYKNSLNGTPRAKVSLNILDFGQLVEERVNLRRQYYIEQIYEPMAREAEAAKLLEVIIPRMVFNASFLVKKECEPEFDKMAEAILVQFQDRLEISYTGPWPPYNFVTMDIMGYSG